MDNNARCFIKIGNGLFEEITYKELEKRRNDNEIYKNKRFIFLFGMLMEVTEEEYKDYYKEIEKNRYSKKVFTKLKKLSIDKLKDDKEFINKEFIEDLSVNIELEVERKDEIERLKKALLKLTEKEYQMIKALFYDEIALRKYARNIGVSFTTIQYRKEKILRKLKKIMKN